MLRKSLPPTAFVPDLVTVVDSVSKQMLMFKLFLISLPFLWPWPLREVNHVGMFRKMFPPTTIVASLMTVVGSVSEKMYMLKLSLNHWTLLWSWSLLWKRSIKRMCLERVPSSAFALDVVTVADSVSKKMPTLKFSRIPWPHLGPWPLRVVNWNDLPRQIWPLTSNAPSLVTVQCIPFEKMAR